MQKTADEGNNLEPREGSPRTAPTIGDADNVEKTTWVVGHGTDPTNPDPPIASAQVRSGRGVNVWTLVVGAVAALIALVYGFNLFS